MQNRRNRPLPPAHKVLPVKDDVSILPVFQNRDTTGVLDEFRILPYDEFESPPFVGGHAFREIFTDDEDICEFDCDGEASFKPVIDQMLTLNDINSLPENTNFEIIKCGFRHPDRVCNHALPMTIYKIVSKNLADEGINYNPRRLMKYIKSDEFKNTTEYQRANAQLMRQLNLAIENLNEGRDILEGIEDMMGGNIFGSIGRAIRQGARTVGDAGRKIGEGIAKGAKVVVGGVGTVAKELAAEVTSFAKEFGTELASALKDVGSDALKTAGNVARNLGQRELRRIVGASEDMIDDLIGNLTGLDIADPAIEEAIIDVAVEEIEKEEVDEDARKLRLEMLLSRMDEKKKTGA